jgi:ABC-type nitrate/sulfonate/bicarbonate transport system substrate-binding protein
MPLSRAFLVAMFAGLVLVVAGCGSDDGDGGQGTGGGRTERVRIALDFSANVNYLGIYAAIENGDFRRNGIDPQILPFAGTPAEVLVRSGRTDLGISFPPEVVIQRARGLRYKAVAGLVAENTTALAVPADSPVTRPAQLSGKRYGGFGIQSDEPIIKEILRRDGAADPQFRDVTLNTAVYDALGKGRVDYSAVFAGIDDITAEAAGTKLRLFPYADTLGPAGNFPNAVFVASDETIAARRDVLRRTLAALDAGYRFAAKDPARAARILVARNRTELGKAEDLVDRTARAVAPTFLDDAGRWGALQDEDFAGLAQILSRGGVLPGAPPPARDVFDASLLPAPRE